MGASLKASVYAGVEAGSEAGNNASVEDLVKALVEADVEAGVEANVEAHVEAGVEAGVEAEVEGDVEVDVQSVGECGVEGVGAGLGDSGVGVDVVAMMYDDDQWRFVSDGVVEYISCRVDWSGVCTGRCL